MSRSDSASAPQFEATLARLRGTLEVRNEQLIEAARQRLISEGRKPTVAAGKGATTEFVRIAIDVGFERNLRAWKSVASGQQSLHQLLSGKQKGASLWMIELLEATMDHVQGFDFQVLPKLDALVEKLDEPMPDATPPQDIEETPEQDNDVLLNMVSELESKLTLMGNRLDIIEATPKQETPAVNGDIREQYATALLSLVGSFNEEKGNYFLDQILDRLDKLAGI